MDDHDSMNEFLPLYVSGSLDPKMKEMVERHLVGCQACREDLVFWENVAGEIIEKDSTIVKPAGVFQFVKTLIRTSAERQPPVFEPFRHAWQVVVSQIPLVRREIWPASAAVLGLGLAAALIAHKTIVIYALGPLIAAACMSTVYGREADPGFELALSTPTSPRQILLARLLLVFGYNLALLGAAGLFTRGMIDEPVVGGLPLTWLAPMTFLSGAALLLSMWIGSLNAISITYAAWLAHLVIEPMEIQQVWGGLPSIFQEFMGAYHTFWQVPALMLVLATFLYFWAVWLSGRASTIEFRSA